MVEDSTRYFLMKEVQILSPAETRNLGFAFYTREEAQSFMKLLQEDLKREIPICSSLTAHLRLPFLTAVYHSAQYGRGPCRSSR